MDLDVFFDHAKQQGAWHEKGSLATGIGRKYVLACIDYRCMVDV